MTNREYLMGVSRSGSRTVHIEDNHLVSIQIDGRVTGCLYKESKLSANEYVWLNKYFEDVFNPSPEESLLFELEHEVDILTLLNEVHDD